MDEYRPNPGYAVPIKVNVEDIDGYWHIKVRFQTHGNDEYWALSVIFIKELWIL